MKKRLLLASLLAAGCAHNRVPNQAEPTTTAVFEISLASVPYPARLSAVQDLGSEVPGYEQEFPVGGAAPAGLGLWAGTWMQAAWQERSGRSQFLHWRVPNAMLTVAPAFLLEERSKDVPCEQSRLVSPANPPGTLATCRAWNEFFDAAESGVAKPRLRALFWSAHSAALEHAMSTYATEIEAETLPQEEKNFSRNWISLVSVFSGLNMPTTDLFAEPVLRNVMPHCAPLGADHCRVSSLPPGQRAFAYLLSRDEAPEVPKVLKLLRP